MKSSNLKPTNIPRIKNLFQDLERVKFNVVGITADKRKLNSRGFKHKRSFIKYFNKQLFTKLMEVFPSFKASLDEQGSTEFKISFRAYLEDNAKADPKKIELTFADSKKHVGIQLADVVAGTLRRAYSPKELSKYPDFKSLQDLFVSREKKNLGPIFLEEFPPNYENYTDSDDEESDDMDKMISSYSIGKAVHYMSTNQDDHDEFARLRCYVLERLLLEFKYYSSTSRIIKDKFLEDIKEETGAELKPQVFTTKVIGKLKDASILIASSSKGYKIATSLEDLKTFTELNHRQIKPMLIRLDRYKKLVLAATNNKVNILENDQYKYLESLSSLLTDSSEN